MINCDSDDTNIGIHLTLLSINTRLYELLKFIV